MKQPISYFLKKSYQSLLWEQRRYFDRALHGSQELNRDFNDANSQGKKIRNIEEGWYKRTKKKTIAQDTIDLQIQRISKFSQVIMFL